MKKKIFRSIFLAAAAVLLAALALTMSVMYGYFDEVEKSRLASRAEMAARGVEAYGEKWFDWQSADGYRLTWVAADGAVLYDSQADAPAMENHLQREEVARALATGEGSSERYSSTLMEKTIYRARRIADGSVVRASTTQDSVFRLLAGMIRPVVAILLGALALSYFISRGLARRVVEPLNALNLDAPLENEAYEEVAPLLTRIERQHRQIEEQLESLRKARDEFQTVTGGMSEGLVLLNGQGAIISINAAASRLFSAGPECLGANLLTLDRSLAMQALVEAARAGRRAENTLKLAGGMWRVSAAPVTADGGTAGVCLLAVEVTESARAEEMRREFSANVSHELKTPLQTILGAAELLENGMVKSEDAPAFIGKIRAEATRLVGLIDDVIRLSQLDEGGDFPREDVKLRALADEVADALREKAAKAGVIVAVTGGEAVVTGVRRLIYEIAYNLCDNAIKYNVPGGSVEMNVREADGGAILSVSDTGIGIPKEQQARVFERFYRVDKSHSRATGGTGLGLSIVKHAAQYHGARLELSSEAGSGTRVTVSFPKQARA